MGNAFLNALVPPSVQGAGAYLMDQASSFLDGLDEPVRPGDEGWLVLQLQQALKDVGFDLKVDGKFGPHTTNCVTSFQMQEGLQVDGVVGPQTWAKLADAKPRKPYEPESPEYDDARGEIPHLHVIYEQLARGSYDKIDLLTPGKNDWTMRQYDLVSLGYAQVASIGSEKTGFQAALYIPISGGMPLNPGNPIQAGPDALPPVVAFRGTDNTQGVLDDINPAGVGTYQMAMHDADVMGLIAKAASYGYGPPDVIGHSLGGAQAQLAAARYASMVGDVVTFQAPGIPAEEAAKVDPEVHKSSHYRVQGDLVPAGGEKVTTGNIYTFDGTADLEAKSVSGRLMEMVSEAHLAKPLAAVNDQRRADHREHVGGLERLYPEAAFDAMTVRKTVGDDVAKAPGVKDGEKTRKGVGNRARAFDSKAKIAEHWGKIRPDIVARARTEESAEDVGKWVRESFHKEAGWFDGKDASKSEVEQLVSQATRLVEEIRARGPGSSLGW
jgi:peptidoglycan hydrolase-like protein with peptidoglycan-binding domain